MPYDLDRLGSLFVVYGTHLLGALGVALIGVFVAGRVERITRRGLLAAPHMDPTVGAFLSSLAYYAVLLVVVLIILQVIGIQATSIVAVLGAATLAIGLALQGTATVVIWQIKNSPRLKRKPHQVPERSVLSIPLGVKRNWRRAVSNLPRLGAGFSEARVLDC